MRAEELRIGNWIEYNQPTKKVYTTVQESTFSVNVEKLFKPIPLTEEWLVRFGYRKNSHGHYDMGFGLMRVIKHNKNLHVYSNGFRTWSNEDILGGFSWGKTRIGYVHQLQNLYFALTGEELKLKS